MESPTSRSLKHLRDLGLIAQVVEKWNPYARIRVDLFGFIDIVAVDPKSKKVVGIQSTSKSNITTRMKKIMQIKEAKQWLEAGGTIVIHGWQKPDIKKKIRRWALDEREIVLSDFPD